MSNIYVSSSTGWIVVSTTTVTLSPGDILTPQSGSLVIDYSPVLERIAVALEGIQAMNSSTQNKLGSVLDLGTSTGIRVTTPYEWTKGISAYEWYVQQIHLLRPEMTTSTTYDEMVTSVNAILTATDFPSFV
jgi:hypothetical protein